MWQVLFELLWFFCIFMGRSRYRVLKHDVGVKWDPRRTAAYVPSHFMVLNPIFCYVSPKIVISHELLIIETCNKCYWIWHALNPKYVPLKQFQCIFPVKINKMFRKQPKFHILLILTGKIHWNCLSGTYLGFKACQIQWHLLRVSTISGLWKITILGDT